MPQKVISIDDIGEVVFVKRRSSSAMKISLTADNKVRVSLPYWVPYQVAINFVTSRVGWINAHRRPDRTYGNGELIGKYHRLLISDSSETIKVRSRVTDTELRISHPSRYGTQSLLVQNAIKKAGLRVLKQEAEDYLPARLSELANKHNFKYKSLDFKQLKARWGSCSSQNHITLNIFLMLLPWHLIDYVLVHELVHTKHHDHGSDFWDELKRIIPNARDLRKEIKGYNPYF